MTVLSKPYLVLLKAVSFSAESYWEPESLSCCPSSESEKEPDSENESDPKEMLSESEEVS